MADAVWHVGKGGQQLGPFTAEDLRAKLASGEVAPSDLVWKEGMAQWTPLADVPELKPPQPALTLEAPAPEPAADAGWYIGRGGQQLGPYSTGDLKAMAAQGGVTSSDLIWKEGMAEWKPIAAIPEFAGQVKAGPPGLPPMAPAGPSAAGLVFASLQADLKAILADPDQGLKDAADRKALVNSCVWIALLAVVAGLLGLQAVAAIPFASGGDVVKAFFKSLLSGVVAQGVLFGALYLTLGPVLKATTDWKASLTITGLFAIPLGLAGAVIFVFAWLTWYAVGLWAGALPMAILVLYETFLHVSKASRKVALYAIPAICLATTIVLGILMRIFAI